ncbi:hypothetical protein IIA95_00055 [Patescibacteria group bacterium]|nr:hypothetical protein [Patescibacteria group bacterium]
MFNKIFIIVLLVSSFMLAIHFADAAQGIVKQFEGFGKEPGQAFINFLVWLFPLMLASAMVLAVLMIIFAGFQWMAGAVSPPQVEEAKKKIWAAVIGLTLALTSFLILKTINPDLVSLRNPRTLVVPKPPEIPETPVTQTPLECYQGPGGFFNNRQDCVLALPAGPIRQACIGMEESLPGALECLCTPTGACI